MINRRAFLIGLSGLPLIGAKAYVPSIETQKKREESKLESKIEEYIKSEKRKKKLIKRSDKTSWLVIDLQKNPQGNYEELVNINGHIKRQAASLIKPAVACANLIAAEKGDLNLDKDLIGRIGGMIVSSSNKKTSESMRVLKGPKKTQEVLTETYPHIFKDTRLVEYIPNNGKTYRNASSAQEYGRFLVGLWEEIFPHNDLIKSSMMLSQSNRIYTNVESMPEGTIVYNKTGSTAQLCGDMGIISMPNGNSRINYALVGIIENSKNKSKDYGFWMKTRGEIIRGVSEIVCQEMKERYNMI